MRPGVLPKQSSVRGRDNNLLIFITIELRSGLPRELPPRNETFREAFCGSVGKKPDGPMSERKSKQEELPMKRMTTTLLAAALAGGSLGAATAAFAETTIYGSVRSGIYHLDSDGGAQASWDLGSVDAGDLTTSDRLWSRIGVRASHDLGNGMTSGLHIEKRIDSWRTRHQNVWLSGAFGKVTLGQQGRPFHSAVSWDGTNLFGNWNQSPHGGSRTSGIKYSSTLDGPFSFEVMMSDDTSSSDGSTSGSLAGLDRYEIAASYTMAGVATASLGYLGQDDNFADVYGGSVGGSVGGVSWDVGYEKTNDADAITNFGFFVGYAGAYVFYEDLNTESGTNETDYLLFGYSYALGDNTEVILEHQRPNAGQNRTALAFVVNF